MIRSGIRAARPLRGRANSGLWNPIETMKALLICVANQRFTTLDPVLVDQTQGSFASSNEVVELGQLPIETLEALDQLRLRGFRQNSRRRDEPHFVFPAH